MILYNGAYYPEETPVIRAQSPGFKWGYGLFETMRVLNGTVRLADLHLERLFSGLQVLKLNPPAFEKEKIPGYLNELCEKNGCSDSARVRLSVFGEAEEKAGWLMEALPITTETGNWNEKGLVIDIFPFARKSIDAYSNLKTASALPYRMAVLHAKEKGLDDTVLLNSEGNLCDTSIANIFIVKKGIVYTPALTQGCVNGVMRKLVIEVLKKNSVAVYQGILTEEDLYESDEVFLTNSIRGIQWVSTFRNKMYGCSETKEFSTSVNNA